MSELAPNYNIISTHYWYGYPVHVETVRNDQPGGVTAYQVVVYDQTECYQSSEKVQVVRSVYEHATLSRAINFARRDLRKHPKSDHTAQDDKLVHNALTTRTKQ